MKVYNENEKCPKCGYEEVQTKYLENYGQDSIKRTCMLCGYWWSELPLDKSAKGER